MDLGFLNVVGITSVLVTLAGINAIASQLVKVVPVDWTSNNPQKVAGMIAVLVVAVFGYLTKESLEVMIVIFPVVFMLSNRIYDIVKWLLTWAK